VVRGFEARTSIDIDAPRSRVWDWLTKPELVRQYMHGTNLSTDWKVGSPITWAGEWKGRAYEDKGTVLAVERERLLRVTHWSPLGGSEDRPENYHTVTYRLTDKGDGTQLTLTQDNNASQEDADQMAENNWHPVLKALKQLIEQS
jgi:uncharacterized protein YndB with AHSA1/START domain